MKPVRWEDSLKDHGLASGRRPSAWEAWPVSWTVDLHGPPAALEHPVNGRSAPQPPVPGLVVTLPFSDTFHTRGLSQVPAGWC